MSFCHRLACHRGPILRLRPLTDVHYIPTDLWLALVQRLRPQQHQRVAPHFSKFQIIWTTCEKLKKNINTVFHHDSVHSQLILIVFRKPVWKLKKLHTSRFHAFISLIFTPLYMSCVYPLEHIRHNKTKEINHLAHNMPRHTTDKQRKNAVCRKWNNPQKWQTSEPVQWKKNYFYRLLNSVSLCQRDAL